jgi:UDP-GlcNAc:undecaprenyl-phosphate GlcNAc-1-phosphate transferase
MPHSIFTILLIFTTLSTSLILNLLIQKLAVKLDITDNPLSNPNRKFHKKPIPLLGGLAIGLSIISSFLIINLLQITNFLNFNQHFNPIQNLDSPQINFNYLILAIIIIMIGGFIDDKYNLPAKWMFIPINLAISVAVFLADIKIPALSYPFDTILPQNPLLGYLLAYLWIGFCLASTKFLDGLDGLVSSVGTLAFLVIASISLFSNVSQPLIFLLSLVCAFATLGFLPLNFPNAKSYLGESGSEIIGFLIGVLSVISGAKIATAGLVIGWFILDIIIVMLARLWQRKSPFTGGREHWHFRFQDAGLSKLQVLILTSIILLVSSILALTLPTDQKLFVIIFQLTALPILFGLWYKLNLKPKIK